MKHILIWAVVLTCPALPAVAEAKLKVGDKAPPLSIKHWIKGKPVTLSKATDEDVIIVEFWATWCGPCRVSAPHMSKMQAAFKKRGVTFIGISNEDKKTVEAFLEGGFDAKMEYTVAVDDNNQTNRTWMEAAKQKGIPTAFVVKGGLIRWIGHPMDSLDLKVAELCGDADYAKRVSQLHRFQENFQKAAQAQKWAAAVEAADQILTLEPDNFRMQFAKYHLLIVKLAKVAEGAKFGHTIVAGCEDANSLNLFAWQTLTHEDFAKTRDLELAMAAARKAMKLTKDKDPSVIDTFARVLADSGDLASAIKWQATAIELSEEGKMRRELQRSLDDYKKRAKTTKKG